MQNRKVNPPDVISLNPPDVISSPAGVDQLRRTLAELREANERLVVAGVRMQELAEEAQAARKTADQANKAKDEFLAAFTTVRLKTEQKQLIGRICRIRGDRIDLQGA